MLITQKVEIDVQLKGIRHWDERTKFVVIDAVHQDGFIRIKGIVDDLRLIKRAEGANIRCVGHWEVHAQYGAQFVFDSVMLPPLSNLLNIQKVFFDNLDHQVAEQIVDAFGAKLRNVLVSTPNQLLEFLNANQIKQLLNECGFEYREDQKDIRPVSSRHAPQVATVADLPEEWSSDIRNAGPTNSYINDLFAWVTERTQFWTKPPRLSELMRHQEISAVPLASAVNAVAYTYIRSRETNGDTKVNLTELFNAAIKAFPAFSESLIDDRFFLICNGFISRRSVYLTEELICNAITKVQRFYQNQPLTDLNAEWLPDPLQNRAVLNALTNGVSIITGGPGTGKTYTTKSIIDAHQKINGIPQDDFKNVCLIALSGKAAQRLSEETGMPAQTIHHALGVNDLSLNSIQGRLKSHIDLLIIDEFSTLGTFITSQIADAVMALDTPPRIVILGDTYQLESIEPGSILRDLIESNIPTVYLQNNYRSNSHLQQYSQQIKNGELHLKTELINVLQASTEDLLLKDFINYANRIPAAHNIDIIFGYQILCPCYAGPLGIDNLNHVLQKLSNENPFIKEDSKFKLGDKVITIKNTSNFKNGEIGQIVGCEWPLIEVRMAERIVIVSEADIELAYVMSVHKYIGSETDVVTYISSFDSSFSENRKLIYTLMTRAKKAVYLFTTNSNDVILLPESKNRLTNLQEIFRNVQK